MIKYLKAIIGLLIMPFGIKIFYHINFFIDKRIAVIGAAEFNNISFSGYNNELLKVKGVNYINTFDGFDI